MKAAVAKISQWVSEQLEARIRSKKIRQDIKGLFPWKIKISEIINYEGGAKKDLHAYCTFSSCCSLSRQGLSSLYLINFIVCYWLESMMLEKHLFHKGNIRSSFGKHSPG